MMCCSTFIRFSVASDMRIISGPKELGILKTKRTLMFLYPELFLLLMRQLENSEFRKRKRWNWIHFNMWNKKHTHDLTSDLFFLSFPFPLILLLWYFKNEKWKRMRCGNFDNNSDNIIIMLFDRICNALFRKMKRWIDVQEEKERERERCNVRLD